MRSYSLCMQNVGTADRPLRMLNSASSNSVWQQCDCSRLSHAREKSKEKKTDLSAFSFMKYCKIIVHPALDILN